MIKAFGNSSASSMALFLLYSIIFIFRFFPQRSLAVFSPILLPPSINTFFIALFFIADSLLSSSTPFSSVIK